VSTGTTSAKDAALLDVLTRHIWTELRGILDAVQEVPENFDLHPTESRRIPARVLGVRPAIFTLIEEDEGR
jgi:hypothetical protein